jgi:Smg protein
MFDILMYLFENYIHSEAEIMVDHDILTDELTRAGFHQDEIYRIYTEDEMQLLDTESRGFILFLEQVNVLDFTTREMVIDRVMELDTSHFSMDDLKWVILMVLFNVPGQENAYSQMEDLIFDDQEGPLH